MLPSFLKSALPAFMSTSTVGSDADETSILNDCDNEEATFSGSAGLFSISLSVSSGGSVLICVETAYSLGADGSTGRAEESDRAGSDTELRWVCSGSGWLDAQASKSRHRPLC